MDIIIPEPLERREHHAVSGRDGDRTYVYLASDEVGRLLYVGITSDVYKRFADHASKSAWYPRMAHVRTELYRTRLDAADRERQLIDRHCPPYNVALQTRRHSLRYIRHVAEATRLRVPDPAK